MTIHDKNEQDQNYGSSIWYLRK